MQWPAADEVGRDLGEELRDQRFEGFGIGVVREAVTFEGAGDEGFMDLRLDFGGVETRSAVIGNADLIAKE